MGALKRRVYVDVLVEFWEDGTMRPRVIHWADGTAYAIDLEADVLESVDLPPGARGDRYTILVHGRQRALFFERNGSAAGRSIGRWFVEQPGPPVQQ